MEETFVLQKSFSQSGKINILFGQGGLRYQDALFEHQHGRADDRDALLKIAVSPAGAKVLRREAEVYDRIGGRHACFGRLLGFRTVEQPVCLMVTRRGVPLSRCDAGLRLDAAGLGRAARDLFSALTALAEAGFAHRAVSADSVFWDGLRVELQEFGHVEPIGPGHVLGGSALATPTGLPVSPVPDVRAAADVVYRLATGGPSLHQGGDPAAMMRELAQIDAGLAAALEPAFQAAPGQHIPAAEIANRLWNSRPKPAPAPNGSAPGGSAPAGTASPPSPLQDQRNSQDHAHRMEFRELRRQQREFRRATSAHRAKPTPRATRSPLPPAPGPAPRSRDLHPALLVSAGAVVMTVILVVVLVVMSL